MAKHRFPGLLRGESRRDRTTTAFRSRRSARSGQTFAEYVILVSILSIACLVAAFFFGTAVWGVFYQLTMALNGENVDNSLVQQAYVGIVQDAAILYGMGNFDQAVNVPPLPPLPPPAPPPTSDPLAYSATHHLGDNWAVGQPGQGQLVNEGLSYSITFELTQEMINYANYASDGKLYISFEAGNYVDNPNVDVFQLNGQTLGTVQNGLNSFVVDVSGMSAGQQTITFGSGVLWTNPGHPTKPVEYDDYDFWNLNIGYGP